jgi:hypothetical protein
MGKTSRPRTPRGSTPTEFASAAEFHDELNALMQEIDTLAALIVLIDYLDRCLPPNTRGKPASPADIPWPSIASPRAGRSTPTRLANRSSRT